MAWPSATRVRWPPGRSGTSRTCTANGARRRTQPQYAELLKTASIVIKAADPNMLVISAGHVADGNVRCPRRCRMSLYRPDVPGVSPTTPVTATSTCWARTAPATRRRRRWIRPKSRRTSPTAAIGPSASAASRICALIMEKYGDGKKQIALLEFGWVTDGGAKLDPSYRWYASDATERRRSTSSTPTNGPRSTGHHGSA